MFHLGSFLTKQISCRGFRLGQITWVPHHQSSVLLKQETIFCFGLVFSLREKENSSLCGILYSWKQCFDVCRVLFSFFFYYCVLTLNIW